MSDKLIHFIRNDEFYRTVFQPLSFMDGYGVCNLKRNYGSGCVSVIVVIGAFDSVNTKADNGIFTIRIFKHIQRHKSGFSRIYGCVQFNIKLDTLCWFAYIQFVDFYDSPSHIVVDDRMEAVVFQEQNRIADFVLLDVPFNCRIRIAFLQEPIDVIDAI